MLVYRGVSKSLDLLLDGKLKPRGSTKLVLARHDGKITHDGTFTFGPSESNGVRAHHIESGLYDGCYVSTTRSEAVAIEFATDNFTQAGWIYVIDTSLFDSQNVLSMCFDKNKYEGEEELTIWMKDCTEITEAVIVAKYEVDSYGNRK